MNNRQLKKKYKKYIKDLYFDKPLEKHFKHKKVYKTKTKIRDEVLSKVIVKRKIKNIKRKNIEKIKKDGGLIKDRIKYKNDIPYLEKYYIFK